MDVDKNEIIEHKIVLDDTMSITLAIPKVLDAVSFKGMLLKINSIIRTTGFDMRYPGVEKDKNTGQEKTKTKQTRYSEEQKSFLRDLRNRGYGTRSLSREFANRYGITIKPTTLAYHIEKNFDIKGSGNYSKK